MDVAFLRGQEAKKNKFYELNSEVYQVYLMFKMIKKLALKSFRFGREN